MEGVVIKKVLLEDVVILQRIGTETFYETYAADNKAEDMRIYLEKSFALPKLTAEIQTPGSAFYFAIIGEEVIGYIKVNIGVVQSKLQDQALEIERIYVQKEYQGNGIGEHLINHAVQLAQEKHASFIWLSVWTKNLRAISFYQKQGFIIADNTTFVLGDDVQADYLMKRPLG